MGGRKAKTVEGAEASLPEKKKQSRTRASEESSKGTSKKRVSKVKKTARGKRYLQARKGIESQPYPIGEAVKKVKELSYAKFDASVDAHINLGLDMGKKADQKIRTLVALPHGTGKAVRVLVFVDPSLAKKVKDAGADEVGDEAMIEKIAQDGKTKFDVIVATPSFMPKIAKVARILGPKGLMPTPKTGTVSDDPAEAVKEIKRGKLEIKTEARPIVHVSIGRVSFEDKKLIENLKAVIAELHRVKPPKVQGEFIRSVSLAPSIGPSVKVEIGSIG
ncbi:MAG: 50S ribosomal protein L1 [Patescibacteria group bacterium]|nr:MAG: 50S ribosomal protein L1 [Patescibacteria group bacterium]